MRILSVRFQNLNSLSGAWEIDFTHPDYASDGLFAITGPTGSGKTTLLDALCLGLYGRTPRLDKVTRSTNEIMSRQAGECFAEVAFETQRGRYRCHWSQHRARRRPGGELQPARHEIADDQSGMILEAKLTAVGEFVEKVTGMDYERFTRSMLLAQGGFAAFLQASPDKRAPILEQITGTEIYSLISVKVHERHSLERAKLEELQGELKGIHVLSAEEERELQSGLQDKQEREKGLAGKAAELQKALLWLEGIRTLEGELAVLDSERQEFEERRAAFEPEAGKLDRARKALTLEGDYREICALRGQQEADLKALAALRSMLPGKDQARAAAWAAAQDVGVALERTRGRQLAEGSVIKKVRELDARIHEQNRQLEEKDRVLADGYKQGKGYRLEVEKEVRDLAGHREAMEAVYAYQEKAASDAALVTDLSAISRSFESLRNIESRQSQLGERIAAAAGKKETLSAQCRTLEAKVETSRRDYERGRNEARRLAEEITALLAGREIGRWREEKEALKERERLLVAAAEVSHRIGKTGVAMEELYTGLSSARADLGILVRELEAAAGKRALLERDIEHLEIRAALLARIHDLEEDRKRLEDGQPCPLCGAVEHPYARGNVPAWNETERSLKEKRKAYQAVSRTLQTMEGRRAGKDAEIVQNEKELAKKKELIEEDERLCREAFQALRIEAAPDQRTKEIAGEIQRAGRKIDEYSAVITAVEEKETNVKGALAALEKKRLAFEEGEKAFREASHQLEAAVSEHDRLVRDCAALAEEADQELAAALKEVAPFGIDALPPKDREGILRRLTERRNLWQVKEEEKTRHERKIGDLRAGIGKNRALLDRLEQELAERQEDRAALNRELEGLRALRRELFGDQEPDQVEESLAAKVDAAGKALERAREKLVEIEREISVLQEKIALLTLGTQERDRDLSVAEREFSAGIRAAGFETQDQFLAARLSEEKREALSRRESALLREGAEGEARRKDRLEALASERAKKLTDQPGESLQADLDTCEGDLKQTRLEIGGLLQNLSENKKRKEQLHERLGKMEAQRKEWTRWKDLHELIGSADGKKFRNFAQGLTFEMMTRHANRQLRKMTDRYLLIRDSAQPLELNVIDNYQAGEIRSTKNLSGGESFIVSLALALGLSAMASRKVRVDSLFLDEGFGTLDEDALETALETLTGLRRDGKLIGIISHVPALKERIGARIQVTPRAGGHSTLSGPGCRRIG